MVSNFYYLPMYEMTNIRTLKRYFDHYAALIIDLHPNHNMDWREVLYDMYCPTMTYTLQYRSGDSFPMYRSTVNVTPADCLP